MVATQRVRELPDADLGAWDPAYQGANLARLRGLKARYDPDGIFRAPPT